MQVTKRSTVHNIMAQTTKPELSNYYHSALFIPKKTSVLQAIKRGFLNTWPGLTEGLIKKNLDNSINKKMVHLHMNHQGAQSTNNTTPDTDLGYNN